MARMIGIGENDRVVGESHGRCKLTDHDVDLMRELREEYGLAYKDIAEKFEISVSTAHDICNYRLRCNVPVRWKRAGEKKKRVH